MNIADLVDEFEGIFASEVKGNFPHDWEEDFISRNVIKSMRNQLRSIHLETLDDSTIHIDWEAYKFKGKPEYRYGDIAFIFNITYVDGSHLEGVAFVEAKKRERNSTKFNAIKIPQLRRVFRYASHSSLLLYDYDRIPISPIYYGLNHCIHGYVYRCTPYTCAVTVPLNIALTLKSKDTSLYKHSIPISYQFCFRFFRGLDLDFDSKALDIAKGFADKKGVRYVLVVHVRYGKVEHKKIMMPNLDVYSLLNEE